MLRFQKTHPSQFLLLELEWGELQGGWEVSLSEKPHTFNCGSESQQRKCAHETYLCLVLTARLNLSSYFFRELWRCFSSACSQTTNYKPYYFLQWDCPCGFKQNPITHGNRFL